MPTFPPPVSQLLSDIVTYVRRLCKTPNTENVSDPTIFDYINRFYIYDMPNRIQLFQLKTIYSFETEPGVDRYQFPIETYNVAMTPAFIDGYKIVWQQSTDQFNKLFPNLFLNSFQTNGTSVSGPYVFNISQPPFIRGFTDDNLQPANPTPVVITGITQANPAVVTAANLFSVGELVLIQNVVGMTQLNGNVYQIIAQSPTTITLGVDSTSFTAYASGGTATQEDTETGLLDPAVYITAIDVNGNNLVVTDDGNGNLVGNGFGTVNYITGAISVTFSSVIPATSEIHTQVIPYTAGRPQAVLFYDNIFTLRPVPDRPFRFQCDAYYTPAAFLNSTNATPFRWMAEYIARGAARKILNDFGDAEQQAFYEPMFKEQEAIVLRRSGRQNSVVRTATIFMGQTTFNPGTYNQI